MRVDRETVKDWLVDGAASGVLSAAVMGWRSRRDLGHAAAAMNAPSHWVWGDRALRRNWPSVRYTGLGALIHHASALFWALFYRALQLRRPATPARAVADALAVGALATVVDLKFTPPRLTPGFDQRLSRRSLVWVYGSFTAGLAVGGLLAWRVRQLQGQRQGARNAQEARHA